MSLRDELDALARTWVRHGWQEPDSSKFIALHSSRFVNHGESGSTLEDFTRGIAEQYRSLPDFRATIEDVIVDTETQRVGIRWTATATHSGLLANIPATGKRLTFHGIEIIRVADQRVVERWGESDAGTVLARLSKEQAPECGRDGARRAVVPPISAPARPC
jgi:predicted ester cyclase